VPPPNFTKSAHVGTVIVARVGDTNEGCSANRGCAQGAYYLNLNVIRGGATDPDPVFTLQNRYDAWRARLVGRPDGIRSLVNPVKDLPADGVTERTVVLELRDLDDHRLSHGGALLEVVTADGLPSNAQVGALGDLGNGRYSFVVRAGASEGMDRFLVRVTDVSPSDPNDIVTATLWPPVEVRSVSTALYASEEELSAAAGGTTSFVVNRPDKAHAPYWLVARFLPAASDPERVLAGGFSILPLATTPFFPSAPGVLDDRGRAETVVRVPPGLLSRWVGSRISVTGTVLDGAPLEHIAPVALRIVP
jgi:hypothetical protein